MSGFSHFSYGAGPNPTTSSTVRGVPGGGGSGSYTTNLEDLSGVVRKPLPLRSQTEKPTLRYSGMLTGAATAAAPLMLSGQGRPAAVPLFSQSDIQYLRQQVQQYSTPPTGGLTNVLFTSFVHKPSQPHPGSQTATTIPTPTTTTTSTTPTSVSPVGYTHTITNDPLSNVNVNIQIPTAGIAATHNIGSATTGANTRNQYVGPLSAQDVQPPEGSLLGSINSFLAHSSSSSSSLASAGSGVGHVAVGAGSSSSSSGVNLSSTLGVQTNAFIKPQATTALSGSTSQYKSEKRPVHSTISVKETKLGNVIYKPSAMDPPDSCTHLITNSELMLPISTGCVAIPPGVITNVEMGGENTAITPEASQKGGQVLVNAVLKANTKSIVVTVPRPPSGRPRTVPQPPGAAKLPSGVRPKATNAVNSVVKPVSQKTVAAETYGFVTNIPDHPGPKVANGVRHNSFYSPKDSHMVSKKRQGDNPVQGGHTESLAPCMMSSSSSSSSSPSSSSRLVSNMIPKSSIPRPGTAARCRPNSSTGRKEDSDIRNLSYTPTKPYHEVNNNINSGTPAFCSTDSLKECSSDQEATPHSKNTVPEMTSGKESSPPSSATNAKTLYYHKSSKTEVALHRKPPAAARPRAEGASAPPRHGDLTEACHKRSAAVPERGSTATAAITPADEEWEDEEEEEDDDDEDNDDSCTRGERLPGDGEDFDDADALDDDDDVSDEDDVGFEDDGMDGLDDDVDDGEDDESSDLSRVGSGSSRSALAPTKLRIRSATKRLLGLSLTDRRTGGAGAGKSQSRPSTGRTRPVSAVSTLPPDSDLQPGLTASIFPNIPPTINFVGVGCKVEQLPWEIRKFFKWRMSPITPNVVKNCIARSGFRASKKNHDWLGYWGKHMKAQGFKAVREYQKVNHFPGSFQIGRKDRLWRNLSRLQVHFGKKDFGFFPQTFVLPVDMKQLKRAWEEGGNKQKWIIKPPASARGIGIRVIHKWNQIPRKRALIVQRYLSRPFLINDSKFDLRIYVYVTSYDPLRIYVYDDGLVRFASCKYSQAMKNLSNKYMHLTNYSINKKNNEYQANSDETVCQGHKWALKALWGYMKRQGVNTTQVWQSMLDLIVKTVISSESAVNSLVKANVRRRYSCHELFGFDIMLDDQLKPWILEVNISPSLHTSSQLDINVKGGMIKDLMNLSGYTIPGKNDITPAAGAPPEPGNKFCVPPEICMDRRLYPTQMSADEKAKHAYYCQRANDELVQQTLLDVITPDDLRILTETIDENSRKGNFIRAFPNHTSHKYLRFFDAPRYYNLLLHAWTAKYHRMEARGIVMLEKLCEQGLHLENPTTDPRHLWGPPSSLTARDGRGQSSTSHSKHSTNLPKLKKRAAQSHSTNSRGGTSSAASSTVSLPGSSMLPSKAGTRSNSINSNS